MNVNVKKLRDNAIIPTHGSEKSAGYDLYACLNDESLMIWNNETIVIPTGLAMECPPGYFGAVFPRSGIATKRGLRLANCVAVIDEDYRGEWMIPLYNDSTSPKRIQNGERIAQVVFLPYSSIEFNEVDELSNTERAGGGFGSTGTT